MTSQRFAVKRVVVRDYTPCFAATHIFIDLEAEDGNVSEGSHHLAINRSADTLSAVFEQKQAMLMGELRKLRCITWSTAHMNKDDSCRPRRDQASNRFGIETKGIVNLSENRDRTQVHDCCYDRDPQIGRNDNLLPGSHSQGGERCVESRGTASNGEGVPDAQKGTELTLECIHLALQIHAVVPVERTAAAHPQY